MDWQGKTVLVTGAGKGIGAAIVEELSSFGCRLIGVDKDAQALVQLQRKLKGFQGFVCDLSKSYDIEKLFTQFQNQNIQFSILINNAGIAPSGSFQKKDFSVWQKTIEINFLGLVLFTYKSLPILQRHPRSCIINLASIAGKFGSSGTVVYSATKHAVVGFSQALRMELQDQGTEVNWICPSMVDTAMIRGVKPSFFTPIISKDRVVRAVRRAMTKNPGEVLVPSSVYWTFSFLSGIFPRFSFWLASKTKASQGWIDADKGLE